MLRTKPDPDVEQRQNQFEKRASQVRTKSHIENQYQTRHLNNNSNIAIELLLTEHRHSN